MFMYSYNIYNNNYNLFIYLMVHKLSCWKIMDPMKCLNIIAATPIMN